MFLTLSQMKFFLLIFSILFYANRSFAICAVILEPIDSVFRDGSGEVRLNPNEIYKVKGIDKTKTKLTLWMGEKIVIAERSKIRLAKGEICNSNDASTGVVTATTTTTPPAQTPLASPTPEPQRPVAKASLKDWTFGLDLVYLMNSSSSSYDGLITPIPNANDVGQLQDPIITKVQPGSGFAFRGLMERPVLKPFVRWQVTMGYRMQKFTYTGKNNPSLNVTPLSSLSGFEQEISSNQVEFGSGLAYQQEWAQWVLSYGAHLDVFYNLSGEKKIATLIPSGVFFKNTPSEVKAAPPSFDFKPRAKIDGRRGNLMGSLSLSPDASIQLGIGYLF